MPTRRHRHVDGPGGQSAPSWMHVVMDSMMAEAFDPYAAIEAADCTTDLQERARLLEAAILHLTSKGDLASAEVQYVIGYAWYQHPAESGLRDEKVQSHLTEALRINPHQKFAQLYLAHYHFDKKNFPVALKLLQGFDPMEFGGVGQAWRDAKNAELILCCGLYMSDHECINAALVQLCEALTRLEPGMNPAPSELAVALRVLTKSAQESR